MSPRVKVSARAAAEIGRAADWWLASRPAAPGAVGTDFAAAVALLAEQPGIGAKHEGAQVSGVRRLFRSRVGYFSDCSTDGQDLEILAFWHSSREYRPRL